MLLRKIEHHQQMWVKNTSEYVPNDETHLEHHIVTTYWFLFIPIYKSKKLINA